MKKTVVSIIAFILAMIMPIVGIAEFTNKEKGSKGNVVEAIQNRLIELGFLSGKADGDFGSGTEKAVKAFQADRGLEVTGIVDEVTYNALNEGVEGLITFRNFDWYARKADVEQQLYSEGAEDAYWWRSNPNSIDRLEDSKSWNFVRRALETGGYKGEYSGLTVAGYTPSQLSVCFMYPIENNVINHNEEEAELYLAWYHFGKDDFSDYEAIYNDLLTKLSSLYGEGKISNSKRCSMITWKDIQGNMIRLWMNDDKNVINIAYMAFDADDRLDALIDEFEREAAEEEAEKRKKNVSDTSGL